MARSAVTVANLLAFNTAYDITGDAIDLTNDHSIDISSIKDDNFIVMIENTSAETGTITFKGGDFYSESGQGDLEVALGNSEVKVISLESARFKDSSGLLLIDMASTGALTGNIYAAELP